MILPKMKRHPRFDRARGVSPKSINPLCRGLCRGAFILNYLTPKYNHPIESKRLCITISVCNEFRYKSTFLGCHYD